MDNVKAVLIDIDNTLLDFDKSAARSIKMCSDKFGLIYNEKIFRVFKKVNDELWRKIEKKELTREQLHETRWNIIFSETGIDFDGKRFEKQFLSNLNFCACKVDGAEDLMAYLSKKYSVFTASNSPSEQQEKRLALSGLNKYVVKSFMSQAIGYDKPDLRFFDECIKGIRPITKEQTVFIGDSLSADICGAKEYGIKTIWFNPKKISCDNIADYTVFKLKDIKNIL